MYPPIYQGTDLRSVPGVSSHLSGDRPEVCPRCIHPFPGSSVCHRPGQPGRTRRTLVQEPQPGCKRRRPGEFLDGKIIGQRRIAGPGTHRRGQAKQGFTGQARNTRQQVGAGNRPSLDNDEQQEYNVTNPFHFLYSFTSTTVYGQPGTDPRLQHAGTDLSMPPHVVSGGLSPETNSDQMIAQNNAAGIKKGDQKIAFSAGQLQLAASATDMSRCCWTRRR